MRCGTFFDIPKHWRMNCIYLWAALCCSRVFHGAALCHWRRQRRQAFGCQAFGRQSVSAHSFFCAVQRYVNVQDGSGRQPKADFLARAGFFSGTDFALRSGQTTTPDASRTRGGVHATRQNSRFAAERLALKVLCEPRCVPDLRKRAARRVPSTADHRPRQFRHQKLQVPKHQSQSTA